MIDLELVTVVGCVSEELVGLVSSGVWQAHHRNQHTQAGTGLHTRTGTELGYQQHMTLTNTHATVILDRVPLRQHARVCEAHGLSSSEGHSSTLCPVQVASLGQMTTHQSESSSVEI